MKCKIILLLGLSVLIVSCEKITNVNLVDGVSTGKLSYKLNDNSGKGLVGVKVSIYDANNSYDTTTPNPAALVETAQTNQEGIAYFSDLAPRNYLVTADSPAVNNLKYRTTEFVQVVADIEKKKTLNVTEFSGLINIILVSRDDYRTPLKNVGVVAFPINEPGPNSDNINAYIKTAPLKGVTDENGSVSFKVPSNVYFDFIVYSLKNGNLGYGYGNYSVGKGKTNIFTLYSFPF